MNVMNVSDATATSKVNQIYPVLLCGGSGTRLWPLSRAARPKQLLPLMSDQTMLQETIARTMLPPRYAPPLVIGSRQHKFILSEQLEEAGAAPHSVVLEPVGRNTAPALAIAALLLLEQDANALILAQPADHVIGRPDAFHRAIAAAEKAAEQGRLVTFGIHAETPETGYGYIQAGALLDGLDGVHGVERFVEKPDSLAARKYVAEGDYYWNSGIFLLPAAEYLEELERYCPSIITACELAIQNGTRDGRFLDLDEASFAEAPAISIDYAVMEHTARAAVVPVDMAWSDIGSWKALHAIQDRDDDGNVLQGDVLAQDVRRSLIRSDGPLVAALGMEDVVIVAEGDVMFVAPADRAAEVGQLLDALDVQGRPERVEHRRVHRPWGYYETVDLGERFQVKRIMVKPGGRLSLQMHYHRAEHWVVVSGTALAGCDGQDRLLRENESIYIPQGCTHRLENPGRIPLHLIEVQTGAYLGEDDIVRFEDNYGRC
jgi:mannose-1-phosphate guanylyltransferase/mannose-6-phosphate isomerase